MILELERITLDAWPPAERHDYDGWVLGYSGGGTRRTNSAQALDAGRLELARKVAHCEAHYRKRDAPAVFKLTRDARPSGLDAFLADRGYEEEGLTSVQVLEDLAAAASPRKLAKGDAVRLLSDPDDAWVDDAIRWNGVRSADRSSLRGTLERTPAPRAFAEVPGEVGSQAQALGVVVAETLYLCQLVTAPAHRRSGLAAVLMNRLLAWAAGEGARRAFLQVVVGNRSAQALYAGLGFREAYRYWYRVRASMRPEDPA